MAGIAESRIIAFEHCQAVPNLNQIEKLATAMQTDVISMLTFGEIEKPCSKTDEIDSQYKRVLTCRYAYSDNFTKKPNEAEWSCTRNGTLTYKTTPENCSICPLYKSRYIEYPITVSGIDMKPMEIHFERNIGRLVSVKPCGEEYNDKTYLGLHLGDHPLWNSVSRNEKTGMLTIAPVTNPLIYIFETKTLVYGAESWWSRIETPEQLKEITEDDINKQWYVQLVKYLARDTKKENENA